MAGSRVTTAELSAQLAEATGLIVTLTGAVTSLVTALTSAPAEAGVAQATATPSRSRKAKPNPYRTKADRKAGKGYSCSCGRTGLRLPPKAGSFHNMPDGVTVHTVA